MIAAGETFATHRPALLRHCYRMLGSFADAEDVVQDALLKAWNARATYAGDAPLEHWLMRIATNTCLTALARRKRRGLPQHDRAPAAGIAPIEETDAVDWVTLAPDAHLFAAPAEALELRESVALAFVAMLQRLPPRQRAALLLKDVVGWSADEIAAALDLTLGAVHSALHRARATLATPAPAAGVPPSPELLRAYIASWESHDVSALVGLLRGDVVFAMPPYATWFQGTARVEEFLRSERFTTRWAPGVRVTPTHANGQPALAFHVGGHPAWLQVLATDGTHITEVLTFIGPAYFRGFELSAALTPPG